ncbi:MAG: hypothetical protein ABSA53_40205, partial [Streptosporangiaceae bacterium]
MRAVRRIILAVGAAGMLGLSMLTAAPAWASSPTVSVSGETQYQYLKVCDSSTDCNNVLSTEMGFLFQISLLVP